MIRKPLIISSGNIKELPVGDTLDVSSTQIMLCPVVEDAEITIPLGTELPKLVFETDEYGNYDVVCEYH